MSLSVSAHARRIVQEFLPRTMVMDDGCIVAEGRETIFPFICDLLAACILYLQGDVLINDTFWQLNSFL